MLTDTTGRTQANFPRIRAAGRASPLATVPEDRDQSVGSGADTLRRVAG